MSKILLIVVIVVAVLLLMRGLRRRDRPPDTGAASAAEATVRCDHCGLHLPRTESIIAGERHFCCEQHRRDAGHPR